jgi:hypothetical protein
MILSFFKFRDTTTGLPGSRRTLAVTTKPVFPDRAPLFTCLYSREGFGAGQLA